MSGAVPPEFATAEDNSQASSNTPSTSSLFSLVWLPRPSAVWRLEACGLMTRVAASRFSARCRRSPRSAALSARQRTVQRRRYRCHTLPAAAPPAVAAENAAAVRRIAGPRGDLRTTVRVVVTSSTSPPKLTVKENARSNKRDGIPVRITNDCNGLKI